MKKLFLPFLATVFFMSESIFIDLWPKDELYQQYVFVPRFLLIFLIFLTVYVTQTHGMVYGLIFGMLYDIVYTEVLGIYMFSFTLIAYMMAKAMKIFHNHLFITCFLSMMAVSVLEFYVYGIQLLIGKTNMSFHDFYSHRLLPTLVLNVIFIILCSYPLKQWLVKIGRREREE
ncbi:rod shape-determining protein MreD [Thermaerobacillus caldiproteolyticus]|uniref:Rod shape-determining protein MreD n=1 Tax=Thermaerobacillus caldiproteolyticus TaxID=247480 RepID=A0A7W0BZ16_9BACL|nr:rod shape-determining protein MreD [Anoxybacillus caldiproteolyticus]MBA2873654.1 rod shape-determining protein MreD [Anoxybacillus caldiproteolyticus]QPA30227.1 rod shape-determining protein MreD [Anoxybacillus caldiproteolyticus]